MLAKSSNLRVTSKVFIAKSAKPVNSVSSIDVIAQAEESTLNSSSDYELSTFEEVECIRNKSSSHRRDCKSPVNSEKSYSTAFSARNNGFDDSSSESNEDLSPSDAPMFDSCFLAAQIFQRNLNQNTLIRNNLEQVMKTMSETQPLIPTEGELEATLPAKKPCRRRAGKKNKAKAKQVTEDSESDPKQTIKFKTEMCKNWVEKGKCSYSIRCKFAHGEHELVKASNDKKDEEEYKTKMCTAYNKKHYCPYGVRCLFIHEAKTAQDFQENYFGKSLIMDFEARQQVSRKRLPVFESLSDDSE